MIRFNALGLMSAMLVSVVALSGCGGGDEQAANGNDNDSGKDVVIVGTNPDYPPMQLIDAETGKIVGYEIDLMEAIAEEAGFDIQWKSIEWKGIFGALERDDIDAIMSAATITDVRKEKYAFSDPYHTISQRIVVQSKDAASIKEISDIDGKRIGVQLGTTGAILVEEQFPQWSTSGYDNSSLAFADLANGNVFGFIVDEPVADAYSRANPEVADLFTALPFVFSEEHYGVVMRKKEDDLRDKINAGLKAVQDKGIDQRLQEKWFQ